MSNEHPINTIMETAMDKLKNMVGSETIIGEPIVLPNGATAVPVSKVSFGFASGGADLPKSEQKTGFGGGAGGGVSIVPVAFLVTAGNGVRLLQLDISGSGVGNVLRTVPEVIDKVMAMTESFGVKKGKEQGSKD